MQASIANIVTPALGTSQEIPNDAQYNSTDDQTSAIATPVEYRSGNIDRIRLIILSFRSHASAMHGMRLDGPAPSIHQNGNDISGIN